MLADIAPHWEETFMEKGRHEGISLGIKNILQEILTNHFGVLPGDVMASIDDISNANDLKNLTHESCQVSSFQTFRELLDRICK